MNDLSNLRWRKSSRSTTGNGNCVEVGSTTTMVGVRDSKDPSGPVLTFGTTSWSAFIAQVKVGRLDH